MDVASKVTVPVIDPLKTAGQIGSVQQLIALWVLPKLTGWVIEGLEIAWDALKR
jgi:hypothetical protein